MQATREVSEIEIPSAVYTGSVASMYSFIAQRIIAFCRERGLLQAPAEEGGPVATPPLGFCFSFPMDQDSVRRHVFHVLCALCALHRAKDTCMPCCEQSQSWLLKQAAACSGRLVRWTKGFDVSDGLGHDPVRCLEAALEAQGAAAHVAALCNDSVAVLGAGAYCEPDTCASLVLGTGATPLL